MRFIFVILAIFIVACEDGTENSAVPRLGDKGSTFVNNSDERVVLIPRDVKQRPVDQYVYIVDARMRFDMIVDAAPPPVVCPRWGLVEECTIPGLEGPCAIGERVCKETEWSDCTPVRFPRMEVAQWEIQRVAQACLTIAKEYFPESIKAYEKKYMEK